MIRALLVLMVVISSCASAQKQTTGSNEQVREYREYFPDFRPRYEPVEEKSVATTTLPVFVQPKNDINKFLKEKLDSVYYYNSNICCADGFRVLIYVGTSSEEASTQRSYAYELLPLDRSYKEWRQPSFKVKVGDYVDKLEAYYAYAKLVKIFPSAIVVPDKVNIVREQQ